MASQCLKTTPGVNIPYANGRIIAPADKLAAIRAESDAPHPVRVISQNPQAIAGRTIPQPHIRVVAATGKQTSIGAERQRPYSIGVPRTGKAQYAAKRIIDQNLPGARSSSSRDVPLWSPLFPWAARNCQDVAEGVGKD